MFQLYGCTHIYSLVPLAIFSCVAISSCKCLLNITKLLVRPVSQYHKFDEFIFVQYMYPSTSLAIIRMYIISIKD